LKKHFAWADEVRKHMSVAEKASGAIGSTRRFNLVFGFVLLLAGLGFGVLAWRNPLWLVDQQVDARLRLHGVHSEFVTVNGYKMHYLVGGTGRPLVLVHGLGSRAADWANLIPRLIAGGHRVYAVDLLGYGRSAQPRDVDYSISQQAAMVEGFLDSQHLQQVDLAGWSMGGWISMQVALQQPQRVRRLVLLDSAGLRFTLGFDPALFRPESPNDLAQLQELLVPHPHPLPEFLAMAMLRRGDDIGWVVRRSVDSMMTGKDLVDGKLGALTMPVLIGWGDQDRLIPLSVGYRLHAEILQSELDVYANCGHLAPGQCAAQVAPSVLDFLRAQPARMAIVRQIPATEANESVFPGQ
jgi:pimeloyl-ACP methyl ester carboxylesterase